VGRADPGEALRAATRYAKSDGGYVAWQAFGEAPRDILFVPSWANNVDAMWDEPSCARFLERLSRIGRVVCFDKRGTGVSDPVPLAALPTLEEWMDDALLALDAAGSRRAAIVGDTEGGLMAMLLAATHPERVSELVLVNAFARWRRSADYPIGMPDPTFERLLELYEQHWGQDPTMLELTAPGAASDPHMREWFMRIQRLAMPPGAATRMYRWVLNVDVRSILPAISVPTLVLHRRDNRHYRADFGRYVAERIPGARALELPGADCFPFHTPASGEVLDAIQEFLTGVRAGTPAERELATVLFTDIVDSTRIAAECGDARWLETRAAHDAIVRRQLRSHRGREIERTGDGFLATFDGPARAVHCALRVRDEVRSLGLQIRAGLHTGEVERRPTEIGGIAVHLAARVLALAGPGEVLASGTVSDLVIGSGIVFEDRGTHALRGIPGNWRLLGVAAPA
jgi:class 3 adenylate cyclase/pimeloyl-ACP methyl ester carboxylesterase